VGRPDQRTRAAVHPASAPRYVPRDGPEPLLDQRLSARGEGAPVEAAAGGVPHPQAGAEASNRAGGELTAERPRYRRMRAIFLRALGAGELVLRASLIDD